jgi:hypothetical protein
MGSEAGGRGSAIDLLERRVCIVCGLGFCPRSKVAQVDARLLAARWRSSSRRENDRDRSLSTCARWALDETPSPRRRRTP